MRIISDFRDYYDCIQRMGQDRSLIYNRKQKEVHLPGAYYGSGYWGRSSNQLRDKSNVKEIYIGFCGKLYLCLEYNNVFCHSIEAFDDFVNKNFTKKYIEEYYKKDYNNYWYSRGRRYYQDKFYRFEDSRKSKKLYADLFLQESSPIFVASSGHHTYVEEKRVEVLIFNAKLQDLQFYKVFDSYRAFQEISMFLSNIAVPHKQIPHISDEILAQAKGFDKFSFRKDKSVSSKAKNSK